MGDEPSGISGELPELPPGVWWNDVDGFPMPCAGVDLSGYHASIEERAADARSIVEDLLRAAITAAATDAGVVLPEGCDVGAVLRDGVRAHGWWWRVGRPLPDGRAAWDLWMGEQTFGGFVVYGGTWSGVSTVAGGVAPSNDAAARALWDAVGPDGLPMPPLPGVDHG